MFNKFGFYEVDFVNFIPKMGRRYLFWSSFYIENSMKIILKENWIFILMLKKVYHFSLLK